MIWLLELLALLLLALFIWLGVKTNHDEYWFGIIPAGICAIVLLIIIPAWACVNGTGLARLTAFYNLNIQNYQTGVVPNTVVLSEQSAVANGFTIDLIDHHDGSHDDILQTDAALVRQEVTLYNEAIQDMKYWRSNVFTRGMVPASIDTMNTIILVK